MRFSRLYAIIILLLITLTLSSNEKIITLEEAKSLALEHNNLIKVSKEKVRASTQTKKSLFTNYLPKLEVTANYLLRSEATEMTLEGGYLPTYNFNPNTNELEANLLINPQTNQPVFGDDGLPIFNQYALFPDKDLEILPKSGFTSGISLKQPLFTGGKVTSAYKMASLGQEASLLQLDYTRENVLFTTEEAYWRLVSLNQKTKVTRTYLNLIQNVLDKVQDSYDVGMINKNQLLQAKVKYNEVSLLNQEAQNGLELATMALAQQIGLPLTQIMQ
ncbi:TolC family protein [bacterium]|nr:TolC family protein [bacterium]